MAQLVRTLRLIRKEVCSPFASRGFHLGQPEYPIRSMAASVREYVRTRATVPSSSPVAFLILWVHIDILRLCTLKEHLLIRRWYMKKLFLVVQGQTATKDLVIHVFGIDNVGTQTHIASNCSW